MPTEPAKISPQEQALLPRSLGYRMPAEWENHEATWLAWPHNRETWPEGLERVQEIWIQMIQELSKGEVVHLLVNEEATQESVEKNLRAKRIRKGRVLIHRILTDDAWIRDCGPVFILKKERWKNKLALVDWVFNCWGKKYEPWENDNRVPEAIATLLGIHRFETKIVLEGGSIDVNGVGTCLTTESCLLNKNRNPKLRKPHVEQFLKHYLGLDHVIWLRSGIEGDDTDGHIDNLARFVNPRTAVCALEENPSDPNYQPLQENYQRLVAASDQTGRKLQVVTLPTPGSVMGMSARLPASYLNFYIANGLVLVPVYGHPNDRVALKTLRDLFPGRRIVGIDCHALLPGFGAIHCVTCQQPG